MNIDLNDRLALVPRIEVNHYGTTWWDVDNTPGTKRNPLTLLKARASLKGGDRWEISAYGDNLTNEKYFQEVVPLLPIFTVNYRGPTRSYGLEARVNFQVFGEGADQFPRPVNLTATTHPSI
jgi:iron complex outermembrane recepter protein